MVWLNCEVPNLVEIVTSSETSVFLINSSPCYGRDAWFNNLLREIFMQGKHNRVTFFFYTAPLILRKLSTA